MQLAEPRAAHSTQAIFPPTVAGFIVELRLLVNCRAAFGRSVSVNHLHDSQNGRSGPMSWAEMATERVRCQ